MAKTVRKASNVVVWVILGLLVLALAGFGVDGFGTAMRTVGQVGDREISADDYANALQQEVQAASQRFGTGITMEQAFALGLDRQVRQGLVQRAAFDNEADRIRLSVGDERVQRDLLALGAFRGLDGSFDREAYRAQLRQAGLTEPQFERQLREETARTLLQGAIFAGIEVPDTYTDTLLGYLAEERGYTIATLGADDLDTPLPEPDEATLRAHHEANPDAFSLPEARRITYAWVTPEMLRPTVEVDEALVQAAYEDRSDEFNLPERRLVERLVMNDEAEARAALAELGEEGEGFGDLVRDRGLSLADVDLGDVTRDDLGAAAEAVFAADPPAVVGPLPSQFGPALYRVNGALRAQTVPLEDVREQLEAELLADRTRRLIGEMVEPVNDLLAGGATVEEVAEETELQSGTIAFTPDTRAGIAAYPAFRQAAGAVAEGDFPEVIQLEDGGLATLRLDGIREAQVQPFEEARDAVLAHWRAAETEARLLDQAAPLADRLEAGERFAELGLQAERVEGVTRDGFVEGSTPELIETVFALSEGSAQAVPAGDGRVAVLRVDRVAPPDPENPDVAQLETDLTDALETGLSQDVFTYFSAALQQSAGISFNNAAIEQVHSLLTGGSGGAPAHGGM